MRKTLLGLSIASILATTVSCGGGGGSSSGGSNDNDDRNSNDSSQTSQISGTASKGIIQKGTVTAYELDASGTTIATVGTATTGDDGSYNLSLESNYQGGPILLTISASTETRMICDAVDGCDGTSYGLPLSLPNDFAMNAIVPANQGGSVSMPITPLTHMATARALSGPVDSETIINAISEVNQLVGLNIQTTPAIDITNQASAQGKSEAALQMALFNTGLATLLASGSDINARLADLATSFADGQFDTSDPFTIGLILAAIEDASQKIAADGDLNLGGLLNEANENISRTIAIIDSQIVDGGFNPEPGTNAAAAEVAQAKALITDTRTFLKTIADNFDDPVKALEVDAKAAEKVLSDDTAILLDLLGEAIAQTVESLEAKNISLSAVLANPSDFNTVTPISDGDANIGNISTTFTLDSNGIAITLDGELTGSNPVSISNVKLATSFTADDLTVDVDDSVSQLVISENESVTLTGSISNTDNINITLNDVTFSAALKEGATLVTDSDDSKDAAVEKLNNVSFAGDLTIQVDDTTFNGNLATHLVALDDGVSDEEVLSLSYLSVGGSFESSNGSFEASASLNINNAKSFDVYGYLNHESNIRAHVYTRDFPNSFDPIIDSLISQYKPADPTLEIDRYSFNVTSTPNMTEVCYWLRSGSLHLEEHCQEEPTAGETFRELLSNTINASTDYPVDTTIVVDYFYFWVGDFDIYYSYTVEFPDPETADNFIEGQLTLSAALDVPGLPAANVTIAADRNGFEEGDVTITVAHDGQSYSIAAERKGNNDTLTLSNPDGASIKLDMDNTDDLTGAAYVKGKKVGDIETTSKGLTLIRYNDGSFESLF